MNDVATVQPLRRPIAPATAAPRSWRRLALDGAALLVLICALVGLYRWWTVWRFIETTDDAYVGGEVTVVAPKAAGFIGQVLVTDNQSARDTS